MPDPTLLPMPSEGLIHKTIPDFDKSYETKTGKSMAAAGINATSIFTAIMTIFAQMCATTPAAAKAAATAKTPETVASARSATRMALREQYPGRIFVYARYNGDAIAEAFLDTVAAKDEATIQAGLDIVGV
jgi:hypothetical protein